MPFLPARPVWIAVVAPRTPATRMTPSSRNWMDWDWSLWRRAEARVGAGVVRVRVRAQTRPRLKLGPGSPALRTWPWRKRNKVGAHPVQPYLLRKMAPARPHLGAPLRQCMRSFLLPRSTCQNSDVAGPTNRELPQLLPRRGRDPPIRSPGSRGCLRLLRGQSGGLVRPAQRSLISHLW